MALARVEARIPNVAKALGATDVRWRPSLAALLRGEAAPEALDGYLIPSLRVLVDVLATPPAPERPARVAESRRRAEAVHAWNQANPDETYGFIAVWGSAMPDDADVATLRQHGVLLALTSPSEIIGAP